MTTFPQGSYAVNEDEFPPTEFNLTHTLGEIVFRGSRTSQALTPEPQGGSQSSWPCGAAAAALCGTAPERWKSPRPRPPGAGRSRCCPSVQENLPALWNWDHTYFINWVILLYTVYRILLELNHLIHGLGDLAVSGVEMVPLNLQSLSLKLLTTFLFSVCFFQPCSFIF